MSNSPANGSVQQAEGPVAALCAVLGQLGIEAVLEPVPRRGAGFGDLVVVPDINKPRIAIPARPRQASRRALQRFSADLPIRSRVQRLAAALAVGTLGSKPPLVNHQLVIKSPASQGLIGHLQEIFGQQVLFSLSIGNERVNRKPVLQLFSASGKCLGYAKIGTSELTARLVRAEAAALEELNSRSWETFRVPELIHAGSWNSNELLIMGFLPSAISTRQKTLDKLRIQAQDELQCAFAATATALGEQEWWKELISSTAELAVRFEPAVRLARNLETITRCFSATRLVPGASHGDWTAWNMAVYRGKLQVWDWERFDVGLPAGFDALHYAMHRQISLTDVGKDRLLQGLECSGVEDRATQLAYLAHLCGRYLQGLSQLKINATAQKAAALMDTIECILGDLAHEESKPSTMDE